MLTGFVVSQGTMSEVSTHLVASVFFHIGQTFAYPAICSSGIGLAQNGHHKRCSQLRVDWDMIKNIHKLKLKRMYKSRPIKNIKYIGIDAFATKIGHNYMTVFVDLRDGRMIHAVEDKSKKAILTFLMLCFS